MSEQKARERVSAGPAENAGRGRASWEMTLDELEATAWARAFKEDSPVSYAQALQYAQQKNFRVDVHRHTTFETRETQWVISAIDENSSEDFWMDVAATKKAAIALCRQMGWRVAR